MELPPMPDVARRLLEQEKAAPVEGPTAEALDRVLGRVEQTVGLGTAAAATGVAVKLVLLGAGLLAGVGGTLAVQRLTVFVPAPIVVVQKVEVPVEVRVAVPTPVAPEAPRPKPAPPNTLDAEQRIVDVARAALVQQRPDAALEAAAQHRRQFPNGQLAEERDALEVQALWKAGREPDARTKGAAFRKRYPNSIFIAALDALEKSP